MKRSPRFTQGFTRSLNPKLERFIRVNPTDVELMRKKPSLGPQNGKWLKRASFIHQFFFRLFRASGYRCSRLRNSSWCSEAPTHHSPSQTGGRTLSILVNFMFIYIYMYIYIYVYVYMCVCVCIYICVCVCIYIYPLCVADWRAHTVYSGEN